MANQRRLLPNGEVSSTDVGARLRGLRKRLGLTIRDVESCSRRIALGEGNENFYISNAWVTQLETTGPVPSVHKLFTLSVIYRTAFTELLMLFGLDLSETHQGTRPLVGTCPMEPEIPDKSRAVSFPIQFDKESALEGTNFLSHMVNGWGKIPISAIQSLNLRCSHYAYIGLRDFSMYPLLRPGSLIQIDDRITNIQPGPWNSERDRPIYFIEFRNGYACSWCELRDGRLYLIPYHLSSSSIRDFAYPEEAEIVGRVVGVAVRLVNSSGGVTVPERKLAPGSGLDASTPEVPPVCDS